MPLPNLIVPGAQKSATTTFFALLDSHPNIYTGENKEPHFFSQDNEYEQGIDRYQQHYGRFTNQTIIADGSQSYMPFPFIPQRIQQTLGDSVRFIFVLRHPVDRALSAYVHQHTRPGRDSNRALNTIIPTTLNGLTLDDLLSYEANEVSRYLQDGTIFPRHPTWTAHNYPYNYFYASCYGRHIANYLNHFPREQFLFLTFTEVTRAQAATRQKVAHFLNIDANAYQPNNDNVRVNTSLVYKKGWQTRWLRPFRMALRRSPQLRRLIPPQLRQLEASLLQKKPTFRFDPATHAQLTTLFEPDIRHAEQLTGLDLSTWRTAATAQATP